MTKAVCYPVALTRIHTVLVLPSSPVAVVHLSVAPAPSYVYQDPEGKVVTSLGVPAITATYIINIAAIADANNPNKPFVLKQGL